MTVPADHCEKTVFLKLFLALVVLLPPLAWRLLDEERVLVRDLEAYEDYQGKVRFLMISGIW